MIWRFILVWLLAASAALADLPRPSSVVSVASRENRSGLLPHVNFPDGSNFNCQYQDSEVTRFSRDGSGRVTVLTDNLLHSNEFVYDALDHLVGLTNGLGNYTSWAFNQYGWLVSKAVLGTNVTTNGYDADGELTARWLPATGITAYTYDAAHNRKSTVYPDRTNSYSYDADNRLTSLLDVFGTNSWTTARTYTPSGQLASDT